MARNGHKSTPSLVQMPRCDADSFVTMSPQVQAEDDPCADIGRYGERTSGECDNQTFGPPCRLCARGLPGARTAGDAHIGRFCVGQPTESAATSAGQIGVQERPIRDNRRACDGRVAARAWRHAPVTVRNDPADRWVAGPGAQLRPLLPAHLRRQLLAALQLAESIEREISPAGPDMSASYGITRGSRNEAPGESWSCSFRRCHASAAGVQACVRAGRRSESTSLRGLVDLSRARGSSHAAVSTAGLPGSAGPASG
jgi:hypothetical protein